MVLSGRRIIAPLLLCAAFVSLACVWRGFILDDSFITYRYSENLARHGALTWNLGHDPVEGFTSFLWMLVNAAGIALGLSAVVTSQVISVLAACVMIWALWQVLRPVPVMLAVALVAGIALSPVMALHATQGMETMLAGFLYFLSTLGLVFYLKGGPTRWAALWILSAVLSFMARPEAALFQLPMFVASLLLLRPDQRRVVAKLALPAIVFCIAYTAFRYWHFGYLFPNTFYIKGAGERPLWSGAGYMARFVQKMLAPYLILWLALVLLALRRAPAMLRPYGPAILGLAVAAGYLLTILPIQGYLHRFAAPLLPSLLLLASLLAAELYRSGYGPAAGRGVLIAAGVMLGLVALWPLRMWPQVSFETAIRSQTDRVLAGKALAGLEGRMFVTEAGALPYYSGWIATDHLGLNDEVIAQEGRLTRAHIEAFAPDMIMALFRAPVNWESYPVMLDYMADQGFVPVSVNHKTNYPMDGREDQIHIYFVNPDAPLSAQITRRLHGIEGIDYLDTAPYLTSFQAAIRSRGG